MKIAILCCSPAWGGLEKNVLNFSRWLSERNNDVLLIVSPKSHLARQANDLGITTSELEASDKKHLNFKAAFALKKILIDHDYRHLIVAHYQQVYTAALAKIFSYKKHLKLIYLQQMQHPAWKKDLYRALLYKMINIWITPLEYLITQIKKNTVIANQNIRILPLCCDTEYFTNEKITKEDACKLLNLPADKYIAGIIGRIDKEKGQEYLLKAIKILNDKGLDVHAAIIGNETEGGTGYIKRLYDLCDKYQIKANVHFSPYQSEVSKAFRAFDVFTLCSISEPFGMVTVEAMLSGTPVIGTNSGGTTEILENGKAGLLVPPKDAEALANTIESLIIKPEIANKLKDTAQKAAIKKYNHTNWCEEIEKMVSEI
jgi:D-inositol-3-phosphate glycosyltransferase